MIYSSSSFWYENDNYIYDIEKDISFIEQQEKKLQEFLEAYFTEDGVFTKCLSCRLFKQTKEYNSRDACSIYSNRCNFIIELFLHTIINTELLLHTNITFNTKQQQQQEKKSPKRSKSLEPVDFIDFLTNKIIKNCPCSRCLIKTLCLTSCLEWERLDRKLNKMKKKVKIVDGNHKEK